MFAMDQSTEFTPRKLTVPKPKAVQRGDHRAEAGQVLVNDQRIAAITSGMPYGRKNAQPPQRLNRAATESSSSARIVANSSMTGIWTTPNSSTRPTPRRNDGSENTCVQLASPREHRRRGAGPEAKARRRGP